MKLSRHMQWILYYLAWHTILLLLTRSWMFLFLIVSTRLLHLESLRRRSLRDMIWSSLDIGLRSCQILLAWLLIVITGVLISFLMIVLLCWPLMQDALRCAIHVLRPVMSICLPTPCTMLLCRLWAGRHLERRLRLGSGEHLGFLKILGGA